MSKVVNEKLLESISIISKKKGPIVALNVAIPCIEYPKMIAMKDYSMNQELYHTLRDMGIVGECIDTLLVEKAKLLVCPFYRERMLKYECHLA